MNEAELRLRLSEAIDRSMRGEDEPDTGDKIVGPRKYPRLCRIDMKAWNIVYAHLEGPLVDAVMDEDWVKVASLWSEKKWMVERFMRGEPIE